MGELASRLRRLVREETQRSGTEMQRFRVRQASPLLIEEVEGDLVLEEGDPDLTLGDLLRKHIAANEVEEDDQVIVVKSSGEWHALDVVTDRTAWEG